MRSMEPGGDQDALGVNVFAEEIANSRGVGAIALRLDIDYGLNSCCHRLL